MKKAIIVIPIYKEIPTLIEKASFQQCLRVLNKFDITFIAPEHLDITEYTQIAHEFSKTIAIQYFSKDNFISRKSYSKLLLSHKFYECFSSYEYMLIYQLDAWVFKDELEYWCDMEYDYIGAPWFKHWGNANKSSSMQARAGNGGFSLRKISSFIKVLKMPWPHNQYLRRGKLKKRLLNGLLQENKNLKTVQQAFIESSINEDHLFAFFANTKDCEFKVSDAHTAIKFSFEVNPRLLYELNDFELPFGCHAFETYDNDFWKDKIILSSNGK